MVLIRNIYCYLADQEVPSSLNHKGSPTFSQKRLFALHSSFTKTYKRLTDLKAIYLFLTMEIVKCAMLCFRTPYGLYCYYCMNGINENEVVLACGCMPIFTVMKIPQLFQKLLSQARLHLTDTYRSSGHDCRVSLRFVRKEIRLRSKLNVKLNGKTRYFPR